MKHVETTRVKTYPANVNECPPYHELHSTGYDIHSDKKSSSSNPNRRSKEVNRARNQCRTNLKMSSRLQRDDKTGHKKGNGAEYRVSNPEVKQIIARSNNLCRPEGSALDGRSASTELPVSAYSTIHMTKTEQSVLTSFSGQLIVQ